MGCWEWPTLPALAKPLVNSNTEKCPHPPWWLFVLPHKPVSGSRPQPLKRRERWRQGEEKAILFLRPFIKQELLHDNSIFISVSVEKIISLYIQEIQI